MTQNPFGGEGGFDMNALLQQAQQMQEQLMSAQAASSPRPTSTAPSAAAW